jgi:hypothetical protein
MQGTIGRKHQHCSLSQIFSLKARLVMIIILFLQIPNDQMSEKNAINFLEGADS